MATRNPRRCRNCPENRPNAPTPATSQPTLAITCQSEGERLWRHVLFGTSTCVRMIEGYSQFDMPGDPREQLYAIRDTIQSVIDKYEAKHNESFSAAERLAPTGEGDAISR